MGLGGTKLVIPKFHGAKLADIPDEDLAELLVCSSLFSFLSGYSRAYQDFVSVG